MRSLVTRHPLLVVVTNTLAGILSLLWPLWLSGLSIAAQVLLGRATISLLAAGLLVWLGWSREAGFVRPRTWRVAIPYLPILLIILVSVVPPLVTNGVRVTALGTILVGLLAYLLGGFFEEALFRGVVLRVLLPFGLMRAAIFSAMIFGLAHASNLLAGADPWATAMQVVSAGLIGFVFVAPLAYTRNIWPLVFIHTLNNFANFLSLGGFVGTAATSQRPTPDAWISGLITFGLLAVYGYWLLRRVEGRTAMTLSADAA